MKSWSLYLVLIPILVLVGCENLFNKPDQVSSADITDAYYLGIDRAKDVHSDENFTSNLVKITTETLDSNPIPVKFLDNSGNPIGNSFIYLYVQDIIILSERYTVITGDLRFTLKGDELRSNCLLMDNVSGAIYDLNNNYGYSPYNRYFGSKYHQQDKFGNIYFYARGIYRLVFQDIDFVYVEYYLDYPMENKIFFVDMNGNVFFNDGRLVKLASGGIIPTNIDYDMICFNGFDGNTYSFDRYNRKYLKLSFGDQTINMETIVQTPYHLENYNDYLYYSDKNHNKHFLLSTIMIATPVWDVLPETIGIAFDEVEYKAYQIIRPDNEVFEGWDLYNRKLGMESNYLWLLYEEKLLVINLESYDINEQEELLELNDFIQFELPDHIEIFGVNFTDEGIVEFTGYDLIAEKKVNGIVSMENGVEYFEQDSELGSVRLTRIR